MPRLSLWKKIAIGIGGGIVLCAICGFGIYAFSLWGGGGKPATLGVAIDVDQAFVQAIHDQRYETAYAMLSEVFVPQISIDQFTKLIQRDGLIFSTFQRLDVCDWGFFISNGRVIDSSGLLYY